jgi:hypothetical protein
VTMDSSPDVGNPERTSIMHDGKATIDLRRKLTREEFGLLPGENSTAYQVGFKEAAGVGSIVTTVILPTGTLRIPAFAIAVNVGDLVTHAPLPPRDIVVQREFDTPEEALRSVAADAPVLGLSRPDLDLLLSRVGGTSGTRIPQSGVANGFVKDWLATYVDVVGSEDGTVGVNYHFTIDQFHNPVLDKIVHDGVFGVDLTHRPSRAELGFQEYDDFAYVEPAWNETMSVRLTLPGGVVQRPIRLVVSTAEDTEISLLSGGIQDVQRTLLADAPVLGVAPSAVAAAFTGTPGLHVTTLPGRSTAVYDVAVRVEAAVGQPGAYAAGLTYTFTYH